MNKEYIKKIRFEYYYRRLNRVLSFLINKEKRVFYYGTVIEGLIPCFNSSHCKIIKSSDSNLDENQNIFIEQLGEKFDYIVLNEVIGEADDIVLLLNKIHDSCKDSTRLIIIQKNYIWQSLLEFTGKLGFKDKEKTQNWLSIEDLVSYLRSANFEYIRSYRDTIMPLKLMFLGPLLNQIFNLLPFFDWLKLDQYLIARPWLYCTKLKKHKKGSLSICITVRDEKGNIEPLIKSLPHLTESQEILFVEGHSKDGTKEEIERVSREYPDKNIKVIGQPGIGQGDAIRAGFIGSNNDIIILYEGDCTSDPADIQHFYNAINSGCYDFVGGSRFVYPSEGKAMPLANKLGNIFFSKWFSLFLGQRTTDVLGGIKAISKENYQNIHDTWGFLGINDPFGDFELLFGAVRNNLIIGEIPMHYNARFYGTSKSKVIQHGFILFKMACSGYWTFRTFLTGKK